MEYQSMSPPTYSPARESRHPALHGTSRQRVTQACEPCRRRKARCNAANPCERCKELSIPCYYAESRRKKPTTYDTDMQDRIAIYEDILRKLHPQVDEEGRHFIELALEAPQGLKASKSAYLDSHDAGTGFEDERTASASAGSPRFQNIFLGNPNQDDSIGFLGKASAAMWMDDIVTELAKDTSESDFVAPVDLSQDDLRLLHKTSKYFLVDLQHQDFGAGAESVQRHDVPKKEQADKLVTAYFETVHPCFPIIMKEEFLFQYDEFFADPIECQPCDSWLASLNLVFAMGALYQQRAAIEGMGFTGRDHVLYFLRARLLTSDPIALPSNERFVHTQMTALQGMYLACSHQVNRAWNITGQAIRSAYVLGLHLRQSDDHLSERDIEYRSRLWHCINNLELYLCVLTGRPMATHAGFYSAPIFASADVSLTPGGTAYSPDKIDANVKVDAFKVGVYLDAIIASTLSSIFLAEAVDKSWATIQSTIEKLNIKLGRWRSKLPTRFLINEGPPGEEKAPVIERMAVNCRYFSASMLINRVCVCDTRRHAKAIPSQSQHSKDGDLRFAQTAIGSAINLINLFVEIPNAIEMYRTAPWWSVLHYITQAGAILVLEIWCGMLHDPDRKQEIVHGAVKVVDWLSDMSTTDLAAEKAYLCLGRLLQLALPHVDLQSKEMSRVLQAQIVDFQDTRLAMEAMDMDLSI